MSLELPELVERWPCKPFNSLMLTGQLIDSEIVFISRYDITKQFTTAAVGLSLWRAAIAANVVPSVVCTLLAAAAAGGCFDSNDAVELWKILLSK